MPKNQVYCAEKLRKTLLFDGDRQIGARIENLVAGTSFPIPADKTVIEWSESPRGRKRVFDCSLARVTGVDGGGYSLADDGGLFSVRIDFSAGADGALLKTVSVSASRDVFLRAVTADAFNRAGYSRTQAKSGDLVEQGAPVYKIITSDQWSLLFAMDEQDRADYGGESQLHVTFPGYDLELTGDFSVITGADGNTYGKLDFTKYMVQFESERFLTFEISAEGATGLKIPRTAVTQKQFYLIPEEYLAYGGDSTSEGFMKETYSEQDGSASIVFVPTTLYNSVDGYYYIEISDQSEIKAGDYLVKPGSSDRFQVGQTAALDGVYNINRGYTVFRQLEILNSNEEYYIVAKGTSYGLSVYDHIVLDASTVTEGAIIYQ